MAKVGREKCARDIESTSMADEVYFERFKRLSSRGKIETCLVNVKVPGVALYAKENVIKVM